MKTTLITKQKTAETFLKETVLSWFSTEGTELHDTETWLQVPVHYMQLYLGDDNSQKKKIVV